jgi:hypothetical protein
MALSIGRPIPTADCGECGASVGRQKLNLHLFIDLADETERKLWGWFSVFLFWRKDV